MQSTAVEMSESDYDPAAFASGFCLSISAAILCPIDGSEGSICSCEQALLAHSAIRWYANLYHLFVFMCP